MNYPGTIRLATAADRPHFLRLWRAFLTEQRELGSHIHATENNVQRNCQVFDAYCGGGLAGFTLLWIPPGDAQPEGLIMAGETPAPMVLDTDLGRSGLLWGVYVSPEYRGLGIGLSLEFAALPLGIDYGFDTVETSVRTTNTHGERMASGFGTRPAMVWSWVPLGEVKPK